ncbi:MAG: sulfite exporter TauE/SafE family protein [Betaproteobacteria bacterium]
MDAQSLLLAALFFGAAVLYSSVGHGGASGYLAAMGLMGIPAPLLRPTALLMNVAVATISMLRFARAGRATGGTHWRLFWPFALGSVPLAYIGGRLALPTHIHAAVVGAVLLYSAVRMLLETRPGAPPPLRSGRPLPPLAACIAIGAAIGLLSGLTGVGGGIFLSPLIVLMGWATVREAAAPTAAFILVNSISGLAGLYARRPELPDALPLWLAAVVAGGLIGSWYGASKWNSVALRRALAAVLAIAGLKMIF